MKQGRGKAKGSAFEREVCKRLSLWVTKKERDDVFWRSAISGGRATVSSKKGHNMSHVSGDICAVHPAGFPLIEAVLIECKFYKDLTFSALVTSNSGLIARFWDKAQEQARQNKKLPMLILKQNQMPALVGLDAVGAEVFNLTTQLSPEATFPQMDLELYSLEGVLDHGTPPGRQLARVRPTLNLKRKG